METNILGEKVELSRHGPCALCQEEVIIYQWIEKREKNLVFCTTTYQVIDRLPYHFECTQNARHIQTKSPNHSD